MFRTYENTDHVRVEHKTQVQYFGEFLENQPRERCFSLYLGITDLFSKNCYIVCFTVLRSKPF